MKLVGWGKEKTPKRLCFPMGKQSRFENGKTARALEPGALHSVVNVCVCVCAQQESSRNGKPTL